MKFLADTVVRFELFVSVGLTDLTVLGKAAAVAARGARRRDKIGCIAVGFFGCGSDRSRES